MKLFHLEPQIQAWENSYRIKGRLWAGGVKDFPKLSSDSLVLELGCGDGKILTALEGQISRVVALDFSIEALRLSCKESPTSCILLADARHLPLKKDSFDAVFAFHVIGHQLEKDRQRFAKEILRVVRRGGAVFFRDFSRSDFRAENGKRLEDWTIQHKNGIITHFFDEVEVQELFKDFEQITVSTKCWTLRVRGQNIPRAEVIGSFRRI